MLSTSLFPVARLVPEDELEAEVAAVCAAIAAKPRAVIALGKQFYQRQLELPLAEAYRSYLHIHLHYLYTIHVTMCREGGAVMAENLRYRDCQEGIAAFKEKRVPVFCHTEDKVD